MAIDSPDYQQLSQLAAPALLGTVNVAQGQQVGQANFAPSPFATALVVTLAETANVNALQIFGAVSLVQYLGINFPSAAQAGYVAPVYGATDTPLTVAVQLQAINPGPGAVQVATVYQLFGTGAQQVVTGPYQPLQVSPYGAAGRLNTAAILQAVHVGAAIAVGGSLVIVGASTPQQITVYGYDIMIGQQAGAVGLCELTLEDTGAVNIVADIFFRVTTAVGALYTRDTMWIPPGLLMAPNAGLKLVAAAGNSGAIDARGVVFYGMNA